MNAIEKLRTLAGKIPCNLCFKKGKNHIEPDGGCRHRPMVDSDLTDEEVINRLTVAVNFFNVMKY